MTSICRSRPSDIWRRIRRSARALRRDRSGVAAIEFAMILPIMLVAFFGTVEVCAAVAIDRKVTLIARTLSDLTSQAAASVDSTYLQNVFTASISIITPIRIRRFSRPFPKSMSIPVARRRFNGASRPSLPAPAPRTRR